MFAPDLFFGDLDQAAWFRLFRLWRETAPERRGRAPGERRKRPAPLLLIHERGQILKVLHNRAAQPVHGAYEGAAQLEKLRREYGASWAAALRPGSLNAWLTAVQESFAFGGDVYDFALYTADTLFARAAEFDVEVTPAPRAAKAIEWLRRLGPSFAGLWPDNSSCGLFVFDAGAIYAALVLVKRGGQIVTITGVDHLDVREIPANPRAAAPLLHRALCERAAPPALAVFVTREAITRLRAARFFPAALAELIGRGEIALRGGPA